MSNKALDRLKGSSKYRKRGRQQLPMLLGEDGAAQSQYERAKIWQKRCAQLEVGYFTTVDQIRQRCRDNSFYMAQNSPPPTIHDVPTQLELEARLRRIKKGKAPGPDQIRSEVCAIATPEVAKLLFPILMKQTLYLEEPIQARGGVLIPAYKGKGHHSEIESYRSLLLSNHFGKSMRGVFRPKLQPFYTQSSSRLHFAAKPGGNVSHASHYLRSFHQIAKDQGWSSSSVFVDISSAFYRIIRQFAVTVRSSKEDLSRIFKVFDIPPEELDKLLHELNDKTALQAAKTPERLQQVIGDYMEATWFTVPHSEEIVGTLAGSRPGDTFADLIFSFVFSKLLDRITSAFEKYGWKTETSISLGPSLTRIRSDVAKLPSYAHLTWADDLVILQKDENAEQLIERTRLATGLLCDICWRHGLEPNFSKGKTECMVHLRGKGSAEQKRKLFDKESPEVIIPSMLRGQVRLKLVAKYKRLGFVVTTAQNQSGDQRQIGTGQNSLWNSQKDGLWKQGYTTYQKDENPRCTSSLHPEVQLGNMANLGSQRLAMLPWCHHEDVPWHCESRNRRGGAAILDGRTSMCLHWSTITPSPTTRSPTLVLCFFGQIGADGAMGAMSQQPPMVWSSGEGLWVAQLQHSWLSCWKRCPSQSWKLDQLHWEGARSLETVDQASESA